MREFKLLILTILPLILINFIYVHSCNVRDQIYQFSDSDFELKLTKNNNGRQQYSIVKNNKILQTITLDNAFSDIATVKQLNPNSLTITGKNQITEIELKTPKLDITIINVKRNLKHGQNSQDCFNLDIGKKNWYGGPQNRYQYWPIEKFIFDNYSYITKEQDNCAIAERYWLNSDGLFIYIDDNVPLFINQNSKGYENQICFNANQILPYNIDSDNNEFQLNYKIGIASDARQAHLYVINNLFNRPIGYPDERMIRYPIWSTWALYKTNINDSIVRHFANKITEYQFQNSQLEIDDNWEICYGALQFDKKKFPDIKKLIDDLKKQNFRVTLWIHPFINKNCTQWYNEAKNEGYLVKNHDGSIDTQWWDSDKNSAAYIDFTNDKAAKWYIDRLKKLQIETGIDSFKFDAGESSWSPQNPIQNGQKSLQPNLISSKYVRTVSEFGSLVEVRSGYRTQDLPIFIRMIDKDSQWDWNNGLHTLITTLFQLNFAGYNFILPDMIGGNGYDNTKPDKDMFIRWLQTNIFMPSLQFSYVPWMYNDDDIIKITKKYLKLHEQITDYIIERFKLAVETGEPVNPPIWWLDPSDLIARQIHDEFLLGDKYLSAPVIQPNQNKRDIYLPKGTWKDGNTDEIHIGPKWLMSYPASLDILPYFIKQN